MPKLKIVSDPAPLTCQELAARRLINEAHCCEVCHGDNMETGNEQAVIIPQPEGDLHAFVCCGQAMTINAHRIIVAAADISLEGLTA